MPPFLPNLIQDVVILEQSTNWWSVGIGAGATLAGAAIGASLGAYFGYQATRRASQEYLKREQLEKIFIEAWACRRNFIELHRDTNAVYYAKSGSLEHMRTLHDLANALGPKIDDFTGLIRIYMPEWDSRVKEVLQAGHEFMEVSMKIRLEAAAYAEPNEGLVKLHNDKRTKVLRALAGIHDPIARILREKA